MTVHVSIDTGCNLSCTYCYEEEDRVENGNDVNADYDMDAIFEQLEEWKQKYPTDAPGWHGGEPLLIDNEDLEKVFEWVDKNYDESPHIQSNGTLISDEHVEMFKEYDVSVGISCDGPPELNKARKSRGADNEDVTDNLSEITNENLRKLGEKGITVGVITVLTTVNAGTDEKLEKLLDWIDELNQMGIMGHYNPALPYDDIQTEHSLDPSRLKEVYLQTWEWMKEEDYREWNPFRDMQDNLLGNHLSNCVNQRCDVFNAGAAKIVKGNGETTGCGKTWSTVGDGIPFLQGPSSDTEYDSDDERYEMLKQVPGPFTRDEPDMGGCKGCDYWNVCQGGCPSAAIDQDYRNRTRWCEAKAATYERIEQDMRRMFPNIELITDLPWNAKLGESAAHYQLDIKPFGAMRPGVPGKSSAFGGYENDFKSIDERIPEELMPELTFDEQVREYKNRYDEENVTFDKEEGSIHADSDMSEWEKND